MAASSKRKGKKARERVTISAGMRRRLVCLLKDLDGGLSDLAMSTGVISDFGSIEYEAEIVRPLLKALLRTKP